MDRDTVLSLLWGAGVLLFPFVISIVVLISLADPYLQCLLVIGIFLFLSAIAVLVFFITSFNQCPKCQKSKAIVLTDEETLGIFKKDILRNSGRSSSSTAKMVPHEKVKFYYRCKYCDHEWTSTKIKRL